MWTSCIVFAQSYATRLLGRKGLCIFIINVCFCAWWRMNAHIEARAQAHTYMHVPPFFYVLISSCCVFGWDRLAWFWTKYFIFVNVLSIFINVVTEVYFKIISKYLFICLLAFYMLDYFNNSFPDICAWLFLFKKNEELKNFKKI